jgi:octaprenyl-diphosphate synthase
LKAQKLAEVPALGVDVSVEALRDAAASQAPGGRAAERLADMQSLFAGELSWVEGALLEVAKTGPSPATEAAKHLVQRGGKRVRPLSLLLSSACFGRIGPASRELAVVTELVHSATLLHDDVIDDGAERRGAPASRVLWGNGVSVLAGDLLLVHALDGTQRHAPEVMPDLIATVRRLVEGEIIQLRGRVELDVSETTYERILRDKTASLFAFATRTGARLAGADADAQARMSTFGEELGVAFQLVDDVLDYRGEAGTMGKNAGDDLREGKMTLPVILALAEANPAEREIIVSSLGRADAGDTVLPQVVAIMNRHRTLVRTIEKAEGHVAKARAALLPLPDSEMKALLSEIAEFYLSRAY